MSDADSAGPRPVEPERRKADRVSVPLSIRYRGDDRGDWRRVSGTTTAVNLSGRGVRLRTPHRFLHGQRLTLTLRLPTTPLPIRATAEVVGEHGRRLEGGYEIHCRFTRLTPFWPLIDYLGTTLLEQGLEQHARLDDATASPP